VSILLEQQIVTTPIDPQVAQLIEQEKSGMHDVCSDPALIHRFRGNKTMNEMSLFRAP
jgi:hypothetical protein